MIAIGALALKLAINVSDTGAQTPPVSIQASPANTASTSKIAPGWAPQDTKALGIEKSSSASATPAAAQNAAAFASAPVDGVANHYVSPQALTKGEREYYHSDRMVALDPSQWAVIVYKSRHQLVVYFKGDLFRSYHAVFGRAQDHGTKLYEGDRRTPEGIYVITEKHLSWRYRWFLTLDYPNTIDKWRFAALRSDSASPLDGSDIGEGGHIGIHGTDVPLLNAGDVNWTTGCISVDNRDIAQLHRILPVGTVVIIRP